MLRNKIFVFFMLLFSMFLPLATAFADLIPGEKYSNEVTCSDATAPVCVVMVIVKGEKFVPFIRIIDSRIPLLRVKYITKVENLILWKAHIHNFMYREPGWPVLKV